MKTNILQLNNQTMTLKEITDLLQVRHSNAMITVKLMLKDQEFGMATEIQYPIISGKGRQQTIKTYQLNKRQSIAVAARLNTALLMRIIDRWQELENKQTVKPRTHMEVVKSELMLLETLEKERDNYKMLEREFLGLMEEEGLYQFITVAKLLNKPNFGRTKLMSFLREKGILLKKSRLPSQRMIESGYMVVKKYKFQVSGEFKHGTTTMVTPTGYVFITKVVNAMPEPIAPPPPPPASISMLVEPSDVELWLKVGWTHDALVKNGKARYK